MSSQTAAKRSRPKRVPRSVSHEGENQEFGELHIGFGEVRGIALRPMAELRGAFQGIDSGFEREKTDRSQ